MPSVEDLRHAMTAATADLAPQRTVEGITRAGRRRVMRRRTGVIATAAAAAIAILVPLAVWPNHRTDGSYAAATDPPGLVRTGAPTDNGEELLLWPAPDADSFPLMAGRRDPRSGQVTEISPASRGTNIDVLAGQPGAESAWSVLVRGRSGKFIRAGLFDGAVARVTASFTTGGRSGEVRFAPFDVRGATVVYWLPDLAGNASGTVTARDGAGRVLDVAHVRPHSDPSAPPGCAVDPATAEAIGDDIRTGVWNSKGEEIVARFVKDDKGTAKRAGFTVRLVDPATGDAGAGCGFSFALPVDPRTYRSVSSEFDGPNFAKPGGDTTIVDTFVGPVDRITATFEGRPLGVNFTRWSAHPEVVVYWVTGIPFGNRGGEPKVTLYDASGRVIGRK